MSAGGSPGLIRVVLCDDHDLFPHRLAEMLTTADDIEVAGEADTRERAVAVVSEERLDVVLLDLEMPGGGAEATIKRHLANTYGKMGVGSRAEATQKASANGWISSFELSESYENDRKGRHDARG